MDALSQIIIKHEGLSLRPYTDTAGKLTIGVGRNLTDNGITHDEAIMMLENDLSECELELVPYSWYVHLDEVRKGVLIELTFNIGISQVLVFRNMIAALSIFNYAKAANELLDSLWAEQVGVDRANNMAKRLLTGTYC